MYQLLLCLFLIIFSSPVYSATLYDTEIFAKGTWRQKEDFVDHLLKRDNTGAILPVKDQKIRLQIITALNTLTDAFSNPHPSEEIWYILHGEEGSPSSFFDNMVTLVSCFPDKEALPVITRNEIMGPFIDTAYAATVKFGNRTAELVLQRYATEPESTKHHLIHIAEYLLTPPANITPVNADKLRQLILNEAAKPSAQPDAIEAKQYINKEFAIPTNWHDYPYRNSTNKCVSYN